MYFYWILAMVAVFGFDVLMVGEKFYCHYLYIGLSCIVVVVIAGVLLPLITSLMLKGGNTDLYIKIMTFCREGCLGGLAWGAIMSMVLGLIAALLLGIVFVTDYSTMKDLGGVMRVFSAVGTAFGLWSILAGFLVILVRKLIKVLWKPLPTLN
ncbi:MAG: hypothetical protein ABH835_02200 [Patescibacteria group bacterium]|nr:hypothetical protein [Patescibacteria group bacterium]